MEVADEGRFANLPAVQSVHPLFASPLAYVPEPQGVHPVFSLPLAYVPGKHFVQLPAPTAEYVPGSQSLQ